MKYSGKTGERMKYSGKNGERMKYSGKNVGLRWIRLRVGVLEILIECVGKGSGEGVWY